MKDRRLIKKDYMTKAIGNSGRGRLDVNAFIKH